MTPEAEAARRSGEQITLSFYSGESEDADALWSASRNARVMSARDRRLPWMYCGKQWWLDHYEVNVPTLGQCTFYLTAVSSNTEGESMSDPVVNKSLAVLLLDTPGVRAVNVTYEGFDEKQNPIGNLTMFKTFDSDLKVGDYVIVPTATRIKFTAVQIAAVDVEVDYESTKEVGWIVGRFDVSGYADIVARERKIIDALKDADKKARQDEIRKRMLGNIDPKDLPVIDLKALPAE